VEEPFLEEIEALMKMKVTRKRIPKEVEISSFFGEDERPQIKMKNYLPPSKKKDGAGAKQEKKAKNSKINLGGPRKRNPNKTKPRNRAVQRNRARK
jgi:ATP-dependent RNA helicase RhlE